MPLDVTHLLAMTPQQFEAAVARVLARLGYSTELTKATGDGGIDIWAHSFKPILGGRIIVQCKRYAPHVTVGEPVLRDLYGLLLSEGVNKGIIATTSTFTPAAVQFAGGKPLELIDGQMLVSLFNEDDETVEMTSSFELSSRVLCDLDALTQNVWDWSRTLPKPYALEMRSEFPEWWDNYWSNWGPLNHDGIGQALFWADFVAALSSLLWDANFRDGVPDLLPRIRAALNPACVRAIELIKQQPKDVEGELRQELSMSTRERRLQQLSVAQSDVQFTCVRCWWKRHTDRFMSLADYSALKLVHCPNCSATQKENASFCTMCGYVGTKI